LNENKITDILQTKIILPILKSLKDKIKTAGVKGINILKKILNFIKTIVQKHPILSRILIVIIFIFVFGIVIASASVGSDPNKIIPDIDVINAAIGFIQELGDNYDRLDKMKAQAYLIDLKDNGVMDGEWAKNITDMADVAMKVAEKNIKVESPKYFKQLMEFGEQLKTYVIQEYANMGSSIETVRLE
jgi:hypothetical protein